MWQVDSFGFSNIAWYSHQQKCQIWLPLKLDTSECQTLSRLQGDQTGANFGPVVDLILGPQSGRCWAAFSAHIQVCLGTWQGPLYCAACIVRQWLEGGLIWYSWIIGLCSPCRRATTHGWRIPCATKPQQPHCCLPICEYRATAMLSMFSKHFTMGKLQWGDQIRNLAKMPLSLSNLLSFA